MRRDSQHGLPLHAACSFLLVWLAVYWVGLVIIIIIIIIIIFILIIIVPIIVIIIIMEKV